MSQMQKIKRGEYRAKALDLKGAYCHICCFGGDVEVHHIDGDRNNNHIRNLLPVCDACHDKIHHGKLGKWSEYAQDKQTPADLSTKTTGATGQHETVTEMVAAISGHQQGQKSSSRIGPCPDCKNGRMTVKSLTTNTNAEFRYLLLCQSCGYIAEGSNSI